MSSKFIKPSGFSTGLTRSLNKSKSSIFQILSQKFLFYLYLKKGLVTELLAA